MKIVTKITSTILILCLSQTVNANAGQKHYGEMMPISSSFFDFSTVSEVDKRRFRAVRRNKRFGAAVRKMRGRSR